LTNNNNNDQFTHLPPPLLQPAPLGHIWRQPLPQSYDNQQRQQQLPQQLQQEQQEEQTPTGKERRTRKRSPPSKAKMKEWKIQLHRRDFQLAMLKEGLFLELEKSIDSKAVYVKVLAPFWRLAEEAQTTNCKADLAVSYWYFFFGIQIHSPHLFGHFLKKHALFFLGFPIAVNPVFVKDISSDIPIIPLFDPFWIGATEGGGVVQSSPFDRFSSR